MYEDHKHLFWRPVIVIEYKFFSHFQPPISQCIT